MEKRDVTKQLDAAIERIYQVNGEFKAEDGRDIKWHGYRLILNLGGNTRVKARIDKVYNELVDDLVIDTEEE